jgi:ribosomal protein S18 acetylase RimI-like enzyme
VRVEIRRVRPDEGSLLMQIRLLSLLDAPYAFGSTYTESVQRPIEHWAERAAAASVGGSTAVFLALAGDEPVGMAGAFEPDEAPNRRRVFGVWVEPALRSQGVGRKLVETVMAWAEAVGADLIELWVNESNDPAVRLYEGLGFERSGDTQTMPSNPAIEELRMIRPTGRGPSA